MTVEYGESSEDFNAAAFDDAGSAPNRRTTTFCRAAIHPEAYMSHTVKVPINAASGLEAIVSRVPAIHYNSYVTRKLSADSQFFVSLAK